MQGFFFFSLPFPCSEFSKANGVKYFAGGDTLLSRFIPLHHKYIKEKKIKGDSKNVERTGKLIFNLIVGV